MNSHFNDSCFDCLKTRTQTPNIDPRMEEGSFNDKIEREKMHPLEKLKDKLECIEKMKTNWEYGGIKWLQVSELVIWVIFHKSKMYFDVFSFLVEKASSK